MCNFFMVSSSKQDEGCPGKESGSGENVHPKLGSNRKFAESSRKLSNKSDRTTISFCPWIALNDSKRDNKTRSTTYMSSIVMHRTIRSASEDCSNFIEELIIK